MLEIELSNKSQGVTNGFVSKFTFTTFRQEKNPCRSIARRTSGHMLTT